jgi:hypothetical protein
MTRLHDANLNFSIFLTLSFGDVFVMTFMVDMSAGKLD